MKSTFKTVILISICLLSILTLIADKIGYNENGYVSPTEMVIDEMMYLETSGYYQYNQLSNQPKNYVAYEGFGSELNPLGTVSTNSEYYWSMEFGTLNFDDYINLNRDNIEYPLGRDSTYRNDGISYTYEISDWVTKEKNGIEYTLLTPLEHNVDFWDISNLVSTVMFEEDIYYTTGGLLNPRSTFKTNYLYDDYWLWGYWIPTDMLTGTHDLSPLDMHIAVFFYMEEADDGEFYFYEDIEDNLGIFGKGLTVSTLLDYNYSNYYSLFIHNGEVFYKCQYNKIQSVLRDLDNNGRIGRELGNIGDNYYFNWITDIDTNMPTAPEFNNLSDVLDWIVYIGELLYWAVSAIGYGVVGAFDVTLSIIKIVGYLMGIA